MSNLLSSIKRSAAKAGTVLPCDSESDKILAILNNTLYLKKDPELESNFIKHVITRGTGDIERTGLHASSLIVPDEQYCERKQVLSLLFKPNKEDEKSCPVKLKRIFEEGNSVHEKWQRLFLRAGFSEIKDLDTTQFNKEYLISYSPDILCNIEGFGEMVVEIKSVNTRQFATMLKHPSAWKQLQLYMFLSGIKKGFVLCEDKNSQDIKVEYYTYDENIVKPFIERAKKIKTLLADAKKTKKIIKRPDNCTNVLCDICKNCSMKDACWNVGIGRIRLKK